MIGYGQSCQQMILIDELQDKWKSITVWSV